MVQVQKHCPHEGFYSGLGIYSRESRLLRYVLICDACGEEMKEILAEEYAPNPILEHTIL